MVVTLGSMTVFIVSLVTWLSWSWFRSTAISKASCTFKSCSTIITFTTFNCSSAVTTYFGVFITISTCNSFNIITSFRIFITSISTCNFNSTIIVPFRTIFSYVPRRDLVPANTSPSKRMSFNIPAVRSQRIGIFFAVKTSPNFSSLFMSNNCRGYTE